MDSELTIAMMTLTVIARSGCRSPCRWDYPCHACLASNVVANLLESPKLSRWRKWYKIVARRRKKIKA
jgi:hypothetical protein